MTKIRRHCLTKPVNSEFTIGPVLALNRNETRLGLDFEGQLKAKLLRNARARNPVLKQFEIPLTQSVDGSYFA